jgi:hypothetical protein
VALLLRLHDAGGGTTLDDDVDGPAANRPPS